jgi:Cof subfamily protein (haloacid dehalogenase superfamily)
MSFTAAESKWKIIACDLDGTLIGWNHKINDRDLEGLRRAREAGFHVAICTGRNSAESAGIVRALNLMGLGIFVNGAMVCDMATGRAVDSQLLDDALAQEAIHFLGMRGHAVLVLADHPETRLPAYALTDHGPPHRATTDWLLVNRVQAAAVNDLPPEFAGHIVRVGIVVNTDEAVTLHRDLAAHFGPRATTHSIYSPHYDVQIIELFSPGANKWSGLEHLAAKMGAQPDEIITIGDDINDLPMLEHARLSFVMASAAPAIHAHGKRMTAAQADCGVAEVIDLLLAGKLET